MKKPLTLIIVTLSLVCTLKGTYQYTLFDVGGVELDSIQQVKAIVTGPLGALLFDVKPEIALKESLELQF